MADAAAKRLRKQQGMPREVAIRRRLDSHPSSGGSRGYSVEFRQREMELVDQGIEPAAAGQAYTDGKSDCSHMS